MKLSKNELIIILGVLIFLIFVAMFEYTSFNILGGWVFWTWFLIAECVMFLFIKGFDNDN